MSRGDEIAALILCAGRSLRAGNFKPLLSMGREVLIERTIGIFRGADIADVLVVLGHEAERIIPLLERLAVRWVMNTRYDRGMFSSVQTGVRRLEGSCRAFFLHPADIPFVAPDTLRNLIAALKPGEVDICRPCYGGRHGHPPLISATLIREILDFKGTGGMRALLVRHAKKTRNIDCDDPGILTDIDTPEDYRKALESFPAGYNGNRSPIGMTKCH